MAAFSKFHRFCVSALCLFLFASCVADSYRYGLQNSKLTTTPISHELKTEVLVGGDKPQLDRVESIVQTPRKWVRQLFRRPELDESALQKQRTDAVQLASGFLAANGMDDVNIDVRMYDPKLQWQRMSENEDIAVVWRYTGGTASWLRYTLLPMRVFHTDHYDPYSNTLHLNSSRPFQALYESALAKEYQKQHKLGPVDVGKGTYAMMQNVPLVPIVHNFNAASDVLTFANANLDAESENILYPLVYSRLGTTAVSEALSVVNVAPNAPFYAAPLLRVGGGMTGRLAGKAALHEKATIGKDTRKAGKTTERETLKN